MISRRELCLLLPALAAALPAGAAESSLIPGEVFPFKDLPLHAHGGNETRPVLNGTTHSGFHVELHETQLAPGARPHPPHHHVHEEIFLIREGSVEVTIAGKNTRIGPGSVAYIASNLEHGILNVGSSDAQYFVIALGTDRS
ncbi:MAG: cupin domain-containing protein [Acidobacteriota bacterium]|nr:cupin domain-containing protein [Acidobacteriota bacterium]